MSLRNIHHRYGNSETFLSVHEYPHVKAWADRVWERKAVQRGRKVNRVWGEKHEQLPNRHSASDFDKPEMNKAD